MAEDSQTPDPSLRASVRDGIAHAAMLGAGETYLGPFGIFLRATTMQIGLLATLPQLIGAAFQWFGAYASERVRSRRRIIVAGVAAQALVWLPIGALPFLIGAGEPAVYALIGLAVLYHGTAGLVAPAWNSLIGDLVPEDIRGRFFGRRNRFNGISTFVALLVAGAVLDIGKRLDYAAVGFLVVFAGAAAARVESARWLARYRDPEYHPVDGEHFSLWQFLARSPRSDFGRFVVYVGTINFAVALSGPYFALYMLRDLHFTYLQFTGVTAASAISQFLTFRYWGGLSDRFGNKKILTLCGWGIGIAPILWLVSHGIIYLVFVQLVAGFVWAGFSLAAANYLFDAVSPAKRARCAAYQGLINGLLVFAGSLLGGYVATKLPHTFHLGGASWKPTSVLLVIFLLSGIMRLLAAALLLRRFKERRTVEAIRHRELLFRISHVRPIAGATFSVLTGRFGSRRKPESELGDLPRSPGS